jgi:hypothetical protein
MALTPPQPDPPRLREFSGGGWYIHAMRERISIEIEYFDN